MDKIRGDSYKHRPCSLALKGDDNMKKHDEKTSKKVASKSSHILSDGDIFIEKAKRIQREMHEFITFIEEAMSAAGSSLTQTEDKK